MDFPMRPLDFPDDSWAGSGNIATIVQADGSVVVLWSLGSAPNQMGQLHVWFDKGPNGEVDTVQLRLPAGMKPRTLQRFPWGRWIAVADAARRMKQLDAESEARLLVERIASARSGERMTRAKVGSRPGPVGRGDEFYKDIARQYLELLQTSTTPTLELGSQNFVNRSTAAGWVRKARAKGFLPPARQGRIG